MASTSTPSYIPQFDGLRFCAAILTAAYHAILYKKYYDPRFIPETAGLDRIGPNCVTFFFVLSGFLITWLLLREKDRTHTVDVGAFYLRRVLRIWPLYYVILVTGMYVIPKLPIAIPGDAYWTLLQLTPGTTLLWFTFFANLYKVHVMVPQFLAGHTWSIAMEEQFYAIWPWFFKRVARPERIMAGIVLAFAAGRYLVYTLWSDAHLAHWIEYFRFDCMAAGGLLAWAYYRRPHHAWLRPFRQAAVLYGLGLLSVVSTFLPDYLPNTYLAPVLYSTYGLFLLSLALQPSRLTALSHPMLRYLGSISYGIYMYHVLALVLSINLFLRLGGGTFRLFEEYPLGANLTHLALSLGLTLLMAAVSYRYLETPFLRWKGRLAKA